MENYMVNKNINNDFISQSYSQSVERITRTKEHIDFQLPKELLEVREKIWQNLFNKYVEEMSDEIELNINTLEPEEDEKEEDDEEFSEEEQQSEQRVPMRKPSFLIQYWIDTGNTPYKMLLDKSESETGSSLSEKEIVSISNSLLSTILNKDNIMNQHNKHKSNSSYSSVDTAVYILSNANITKKADTIAIIEGAKSGDKSSRNCVTNISDNKIMNTAKSDEKAIHTITTHNIHNNDSNINTDDSSNISTKYIEKCDQRTTDAVIHSAIIQSTSSQSSYCKETDKNNSQRKLNVRNMNDIVTIFQQFDKTSKRLSQDVKIDNVPNEDEVLQKDSSNSSRANKVMEKVIDENDMNLTYFHRKKLYTGRNSPVDLMLIQKHSLNKISDTRKTLHPALDSENAIKKKLSLVHKGKNKRLLSRKSNSDLKIHKSESKRKYFSVANKNTADSSINDKAMINNTSNCIVNISPNNSLSNSHNNSKIKSNSISPRNNNDTNIFIKNKADLTSLNPVVLLDRNIPCFKSHSLNSIKNNDKMQNSMKKDSDKHLNRKLHISNVNDLDSEIDSNESTILICECKKNVAQHVLSSNESLFPSTIENNSTDAEKDDKRDKLPSLNNLKSANIKQYKEAFVVLERLPLSLYKNHMYAIEKPQDLNVRNDQDTILDSSEIHSSNLRNEVENKKDKSVKLSEIKIVLERLPANLHVQRSSNVNNINNSINKKNISHNISTHNHERKLQIKTKSSIYKNRKTRNSVRTMRKIDNNYSSSTSDALSSHNNQTSDNTKSNLSTSQHEKLINQIKCRKYSVLTSTSSDDDNFVQLYSRKKLKTFTDDEISKTKVTKRNSYNKTKLVDKCNFCYNKNPGFIIRSLGREIKRNKSSKEKTASKETNKSKSKKSRIKMKSFCNNFASIDSLQMNKSEMFSTLSSEVDDNNTIEESNKHEKKKFSFLNLNENINNDNKECSSITNKEKDYKDTCVVLLQTKTFHTDSSDSERNYAISNNHKTQDSLTRQNLRFYHTNKKQLLDQSVTKKYDKKSLNSSDANQLHNMMTRSISVVSEKNKVNEQFVNREFNNIINSEISNAETSTPIINNIENAFLQRKTHLCISPEKTNLSNIRKTPQIAEKSKSLVTVQQKDAKLLIFQTKNYDSDSSESL